MIDKFALREEIKDCFEHTDIPAAIEDLIVAKLAEAEAAASVMREALNWWRAWDDIPYDIAMIDKALAPIWYLGNQYWQVPDHIERCCECGDLYNSEAEGECLDYGKAPHHFCESCRHGDAYVKKMRRNPDKEQKKQYFTL